MDTYTKGFVPPPKLKVRVGWCRAVLAETMRSQYRFPATPLVSGGLPCHESGNQVQGWPAAQ
jgi:hypothetical protein